MLRVHHAIDHFAHIHMKQLVAILAAQHLAAWLRSITECSSAGPLKKRDTNASAGVMSPRRMEVMYGHDILSDS